MTDKKTASEEPLNKNFREPKIRFPEFKDTWEKRKIKQAFKYEQPTKYLVSSDKYVNEGIPVLTAGKTFVLGYTNEKEGIKKASEEAPVILFDDFTTDLRFIDFDFKIRSSAAKILTEQKENDIYFLFNVLKNIDYKPHDHQRHWISIFENFDVFLPSFDEQKKISSFLKIIEKKETTIKGKTEALKKYKEGLVNDWFSNDSNKVQLKSLVNQKPSPLLKSHFKENSGQYPVYDASGQPYTTINFYNNDQDSVAIIKYGSGCGNTFITRNKHSVLGTMSELIPKDKELLEYIYAYTLSKQFRKICTRYTEIGTTPNLYYSDYSEEYIYIPKNKDKTKKFIEVFKRIEEEESICQNKLSVLSHIKAHLLKNMFI